MYYPDLSPYDYYAPPLVLEGVLTVGWLDHVHDYPQGEVPALVVSKLAQLLFEKRVFNLTRGIHECPLCPPPIPWHPESVYAQIQGEQRLLGISEIWIPASDGIIYAAPTMIYHYITEHQYQPPQQYLDAVETFDLSSNWDGEKIMKAIYERQLKQQR